ncbi:hypothetical protein SNEBB_007908 [Seison nebaliae]|nr:hypothetical protein SNEBB_007908 [Seison nebaliae]
MADSGQKYREAVRHTLEAALCIANFESQVVERYNKPEIEDGSSPELLLTPVIINKNKNEKVLIEPSVNSIRVSINIKQSDDIEKLLCKKFMNFLTRRAERFLILRRTPIENYDISFLITNLHMEQMYKDKIIDFVIDFMKDIDQELNEMKLALNSRSRNCGEEFLRNFSL